MPERKKTADKKTTGKAAPRKTAAPKRTTAKASAPEPAAPRSGGPRPPALSAATPKPAPPPARTTEKAPVEVCPRCGTTTFGPEQRIRAEGSRTVRYTVLVCERGHTFAKPARRGA